MWCVYSPVSESSGAIGNYARYTLRRLEGILNSGPSGFVPSVDEIQAYKERPPILATIELVDGTPLTEDLPITPDLNVSKVRQRRCATRCMWLCLVQRTGGAAGAM